MEENKTLTKALVLTKEERKRQSLLYQRRTDMETVKSDVYPHFAGSEKARSFLQYIDDSEKIINGYVQTREAQGKEPWMSNTLDNIALAKMRAVAAGTGLKVPEMRFQARNKKGISSKVRAEIFRNINRQTFLDGNPVLHSFLEVWQMLSHGVLFEYEGYQTGGAKIKRVKSFDSVTGDIETVDEYVRFEGKPFSVILNPQEFYWWDMHIRDIQDQPHLMWIQHYTKREVEIEFSKFKNFKYVMDRQTVSASPNMQETTYYDKWSRRVEKTNDFEVIRFYSKEDDAYEIWINGVPVLIAPLLWGEKDKEYPFAKTIAQPFANPNFFVGMSFPGMLESYQDLKNTVLNTMVDKLYRSMEPRKLIGLQNRDLFDIESEIVSMDDKIYVPDVNAVKLEPVAGINQGEIAMLQVIDRGLEMVSQVSAAGQGTAEKGITATADRIAFQRAQEIKSSLYLALEDLWLQKTRLRNQVILTHYLKDKASREEERDRIITVKDYQFNDGKRGTLDIHIAKNNNDLLPLVEIEAREQAAAEQGEVYKLISVPMTYLDDWKLDYQIVPQSFFDQDASMEESRLMNKIQRLATLFPEFVAANKPKLLEQVLALSGEHPEEYEPPAEPQPTNPETGQPIPTSLLGLEEPAQQTQNATR